MLSNKPFIPHVLILMLICGLLTLGQPSTANAGNDKEAFIKAEALLQDKTYPEAIMLYEEVLTRDPSFVPAYPGLVKSYAGLGDLEGGAAFIESLYLEDPDNAGINYGMGYAMYRQKEYESAAGFFDRALKLDPELAEAWNNRAVIYHFVERDYDKARQYYEKAVVLSEKTDNQRVKDIAQKNLAHLPEKIKVIPITETLTLEAFLNRFISIVEQGDKAKLQGLVLGQKDNSIKAMDWLLEQAEKAKTQEGKKKEKNALTLGNVLAAQYAICFESDLLLDKLEKYQDLEPTVGSKE